MATFRKAYLLSFICSALLIGCAFADEDVFIDNALSSTWQDWSWGSTISYTATDVKMGTTSISVTSDAYSALSLYDTSIFGGKFAGLKFDLAVSSSVYLSYFHHSTFDHYRATILMLPSPCQTRQLIRPHLLFHCQLSESSHLQVASPPIFWTSVASRPTEVLLWAIALLSI